MIKNKNWIHRQFSNYHILVNVNNNKIITLSPLLAQIWLSNDDSIENIVEEILINNSCVKREDMEKIIAQLYSRGIIIDE